MVHLCSHDERNHDYIALGRLLDGLKNNLPHLATFSELPTMEKRRTIREFEIERPPGVTLSELGMVQFPEEFGDHIDRYLRKVAKAIFYLHLGRPVPDDVLTWAMWSYGKIGKNRLIVEEWAKKTPIIVQGSRRNIDFGNRFRYRLNFSEEMPAMIAFGQFGDGLLFYCACVPAEIAKRLDMELRLGMA